MVDSRQFNPTFGGSCSKALSIPLVSAGNPQYLHCIPGVPHTGQGSSIPSMDGYVTPKFWLSFAAKLLFCREQGEEGAWHHNIQPAYKAVGEHKEAQRLNNIDFGCSVFKLGAN